MKKRVYNIDGKVLVEGAELSELLDHEILVKKNDLGKIELSTTEGVVSSYYDYPFAYMYSISTQEQGGGKEGIIEGEENFIYFLNNSCRRITLLDLKNLVFDTLDKLKLKWNYLHERDYFFNIFGNSINLFYPGGNLKCAVRKTDDCGIEIEAPNIFYIGTFPYNSYNLVQLTYPNTKWLLYFSISEKNNVSDKSDIFVRMGISNSSPLLLFSCGDSEANVIYLPKHHGIAIITK